MSPSRKGSEKGVDRFLRINESHSNMTVSRCSSAVERHPMKSNVHRYLGKALNKRKQKYTKITLSLCQLVSSGKTWFVNMAELWTTLDNMWARNALAHGVRFQGCCGLCSPSRPATTGSVKYGPKRFSYLFSISSGSIRILFLHVCCQYLEIFQTDSNRNRLYLVLLRFILRYVRCASGCLLLLLLLLLVFVCIPCPSSNPVLECNCAPGVFHYY